MPLPLPCPDGVPCFTVITLDAGQGDCTLLVYPDESLVMIDCGSKKNKSIVYDQIKQVVNAYLGRTNGYLRALVLTHPDADHYNLVKLLLRDQKVRIGTLIYGGRSDHYTLDGTKAWIEQHKKYTVSPRQIEGEVVELSPQLTSWSIWTDLSYKDTTNSWLNVDVRVLAANAGDPNIKTDANPNSIVLLVTFQDVNLFLMGDATVETEEFILEHRRSDLDKVLKGRRTYLRLGHHGSTTSSGEAWIGKLQPQVAVVSSDTLTFNGTSIPSGAVLDKLIKSEKLYNLGEGGKHSYVQYNAGNQRHEAVETTLALLSTLHGLKFDLDGRGFTAYGTSWYYTISGNNKVWITPAVGWENINETP